MAINRKTKRFRWLLALSVAATTSCGCASWRHHAAKHSLFNKFSKHHAPYFQCEDCGQIVFNDHHQCGRCAPRPAFYGFRATCWSAWPTGWMPCPHPDANGCMINEVPLGMPVGMTQLPVEAMETSLQLPASMIDSPAAPEAGMPHPSTEPTSTEAPSTEAKLDGQEHVNSAGPKRNDIQLFQPTSNESLLRPVVEPVNADPAPVSTASALLQPPWLLSTTGAGEPVTPEIQAPLSRLSEFRVLLKTNRSTYLQLAPARNPINIDTDLDKPVDGLDVEETTPTPKEGSLPSAEPSRSAVSIASEIDLSTNVQ